MIRAAITTFSLACLVLFSSTAVAQDDEWDGETLINHRETSGAGFTLGIGPYATFRRMTLSGSFRSIEHLPGIYIGGVLDLGISLGKIKNYGTLRLVARGGFASAKSTDQSAYLGRAAVTENTFLSTHVVLMRPIGRSIDIGFIAGGGITAFTVEPNPRYTGHRYITVDIGAKTQYWFTRRGYFGVGVLVRPALITNQSDGADGSGSGFGLNPKLDFSYRLIEPKTNDLAGALELVVAYDLNYFNTSFPLSGRVGSDPTTTDHSHMLSLAFQYNL